MSVFDITGFSGSVDDFHITLGGTAEILVCGGEASDHYSDVRFSIPGFGDVYFVDWFHQDIGRMFLYRSYDEILASFEGT